jgi:ubiquinone/menaquinone biosynthesis C-methylase UbiE
MTLTETRPHIPPMAILNVLQSGWGIQVIQSAVELDVFSAIHRGAKSPEAVAEMTSCNPQGVKLLMDALVGMQLLENVSGSYALTETAALYLVPESPLYMQDYILGGKKLAEVWYGLSDAIKGGKSQMMVNKPETAEQFFPKLAAMIFPMNYAAAELTAEALSVEKLPSGAKVLDVATGSAAWSIPMAQRNTGLHVDALDFPAIIDQTTQYFVNRYKLGSRYHYLTGAWQDVDLPENHYDVAILGHICHSEGWDETEKLLAKVFRSLKPGGRIVVAEFLTNTTRTGPLFPLLFALNMFLVTQQGCVFSVEEMQRLMVQHGFSRPERIKLPYYGEESPVMVAHKP